VSRAPLHLSFEVGCSAAHAFETWTARISQWWPADHSFSGEQGLTVVLEPRPGGRIYERTVDGTEHEWGEVTTWEPPRRLVYQWHLRTDRADATEVEITFIDLGSERARVDIEHRGWERLGERGPVWRERNHGGWSTLLPHFIAASTIADRAS
jgi:uncharacterized protein YndB with AHSA1/START domain